MRMPKMLPALSRLHGHASRQELSLTLRATYLLGLVRDMGVQSPAGAGVEVRMSRCAAGSAAGVVSESVREQFCRCCPLLQDGLGAPGLVCKPLSGLSFAHGF